MVAYRVAARAQLTPHDIALCDAERSYTWAEVNDILDGAVRALLGAELGPEPRIAVMASNRAEVVLTHFAAMLAGVSSVPVNSRLTADELTYILQDSAAGALFVGPGTVDTGGRAAANAGVEHVVGWGHAAGRVTGWDEWIDVADRTPPPTTMKPRATLFYTSGTTGRPKGTESRWPDHLARIDTLVDQLAALRPAALGPSLRPCLVAGPLHHIGPLSNAIIGLLGGGTVVLPRFEAEAVLRAIEHHHIGSSVMVPTHLVRLLALDADVRASVDVSSVERVGLTGAACPVAVKRAMIEWWGPVFVEAYGATESGAITTIESDEWLLHPGSVGRCGDGFTAVVVDEVGQQVAAGTPGLLYFRDESERGIAYRNAPGKTAAAHRAPGEFTLGDIGYVDADGYLFITDRAVDMIVSGGVNIYPAESEQLLIAHPGVRDVAVIGVPNAELGEEAKALVEVEDPDAPPDPEDLLSYCRARLAAPKCPRSVEFVASVGRNEMGKVDKRALRRPYWPTDRTIGG